MAQPVHYAEVGRSSLPDTTSTNQPVTAMFSSNSEIAARGSRGPRGPRGPRRQTADRRTHGRLRELCEEVLASYRLAQGEDLLSAEDRRSAEQLLKGLTPRVAR